MSLMLLSFCCMITQTRATLFTNTYIVDSVGDYGTQSSLALDSMGNPHISYTSSNMTYTYLMYAEWIGSEFRITMVDKNGGANPSIAMDSEDNPHICYTFSNITGCYLMYASLASSEWNIQTVEFENNSSELSDPSLRIDSNGIPHIAYVGPAETLKHAFWAGSNWNVETIDPWTEQVADPSLALDFEGRPWISYCDPVIGLKCASWTGSGWNKMIVDSDQGVGRESSVALDAYGNPHISYDDDSRGRLKYASRIGSTWNIQIVDQNKRVSFYSSLALDSSGNPHISYDDNTNGNLIYARWTGSIWNLQIVDQIKFAPGDIEVTWGFPTTLALDVTGTAHISYCGNPIHDLKYASVSDLSSFSVTFKVVGVDNFGDKVLEVDSTALNLADLPKSFVWQAGANHSFAFVSVINLESGEKLSWASTSGLSTSQSGYLTISSGGSIQASYEISTSKPNTTVPSIEYVILPTIVAVAVVLALLLVFKARRKRLYSTL